MLDTQRESSDGWLCGLRIFGVNCYFGASFHGGKHGSPHFHLDLSLNCLPLAISFNEPWCRCPDSRNKACNWLTAWKQGVEGRIVHLAAAREARNSSLTTFIDNLLFHGKMELMENTKMIPGVDLDLQAVFDHLSSGKLLDPEVAKRVRERGRKIREEIFLKHGLLDVGVPAIRELRGELPEA